MGDMTFLCKYIQHHDGVITGRVVEMDIESSK